MEAFFSSLMITYGFHLSASFMYKLKEKGNKDVSAVNHSSILGSSKLRILLIQSMWKEESAGTHTLDTLRQTQSGPESAVTQFKTRTDDENLCITGATWKEVSVLMNYISTGWTEVRCFTQSEVVNVRRGRKSGGRHWGVFIRSAVLV